MYTYIALILDMHYANGMKRPIPLWYLSSGSTAIWLLAAWPELTNLMALCLARGRLPRRDTARTDRPEAGNALPEIRGVSPVSYAEKYLYPYI